MQNSQRGSRWKYTAACSGGSKSSAGGLSAIILTTVHRQTCCENRVIDRATRRLEATTRRSETPTLRKRGVTHRVYEHLSSAGDIRRCARRTLAARRYASVGGEARQVAAAQPRASEPSRFAPGRFVFGARCRVCNCIRGCPSEQVRTLAGLTKTPPLRATILMTKGSGLPAVW